jgi:hypothetical protein
MNIRTLTDPLQSSGSIRSQRDLFEQYKSIFYAVTKAYTRMRQLPLIAAHQIDRDNPATSNERLSLDGIHFAVDVERTTERAIGDDLSLQTAWFSLVLGEAVPPKLAKSVIMRCGRAYSARKLEPHKYFRPNRYPKKRGVA